MNPTPSLLFPPTSRYHPIEIARLVLPDGTEIAFLRRRFLPAADRFALLQEHMVTEGDRLDNITARYSATRCSSGACATPTTR
jgi:hypothetical protein